MKFKAKILIAGFTGWVIALLAVAAGLPLLPALVLALIVSVGEFRLLRNQNSQNAAEAAHLWK